MKTRGTCGFLARTRGLSLTSKLSRAGGCRRTCVSREQEAPDGRAVCLSPVAPHDRFFCNLYSEHAFSVPKFRNRPTYSRSSLPHGDIASPSCMAEHALAVPSERRTEKSAAFMFSAHAQSSIAAERTWDSQSPATVPAGTPRSH